VELNQPASDFTLQDLAGRSHRLSDQRGRIVIVNFWSAECPWSERADREMTGYLAQWGDSVGLVTLAANRNESDEMCREAARARGLPFVLRADDQLLDAFGAQTTPHLFVLDADGILRYRGALDDITFRHREAGRRYLWEAVEALRQGRLPDPAETPAYGCTVVRLSSDSC
jgi:peroxiredoxin